MIDPTSNMFNDRVFIYNGMNDTINVPGHTPLLLLPRDGRSASAVLLS